MDKIYLVRKVVTKVMGIVACAFSSSSADGRVGPVLVDEQRPPAVLLEERGHVVVVSVVQGPAFQNLRRTKVTFT